MKEETKRENGEAVEEIVAQKQGNSYVLIGTGGMPIGEITYKLVDVDTWLIDHTHVDSQYRGRDLGRQLLDMVVHDAREQGRTIIPSCSYVLAQFKRHSEYEDVWEKRDTGYGDPYSTNSITLPKS
ncbi:GNAT family N-acetyltransferase [Paenibacillus mendelii]|uniref:GNAT family N-acetyltransferase n=1 Tax=Paenibacillus mendelii TaxID=206163 RepID=A0ABV6JM61_9BACL|nr:GNAT family N-acetyltransferase [Paenibacillus mendelii]MCQ6562374.1 N-acetyltransferase [Paenibacillus mendelii]